MSRPSIRRGGFTIRGRGRGNNASPRPKVDLDLSSDSTDLPELETKQSGDSIHPMDEYYSDNSESGYSQSYDSYEKDWKSQPNKPHPPRPTVAPTATPTSPTPTSPTPNINGTRSNAKRPLPRARKSGDSPKNVTQSPPSPPPPPPQSPPNKNLERNEESSGYYSSDDDDGVQNEPTREITDEERNQTNESHHNNYNANSNTNNNNVQPIINPVNNGMERNIQSEQVQPTTPTEIQQNNDSIQVVEQTFQISYEKSISLWKRSVQMTQNDILVYRCQSAYDKVYKKIHIIYSKSSSKDQKSQVSFYSPNYSGMLVRHQRGSRFTLYGREGGDQELYQLAGISFIDLSGDDSRIRYFKIAIPIEGLRYSPKKKEDDLSRIASAGIPRPNIKVFSSALPKKHSNGRLTLDMGPYRVKRSLKNFIIRGDDESILFLIFKSLDGVCKIKAQPPFTPLIAFGLGVSILTSMK